MKATPSFLLIVFSLMLFMHCECEESSGMDACPEEPMGDFLLALSSISVPFTCPFNDFPDLDTWQNGDIFTDDVNEVGKYYVEIRIEGFCDNIGKTDPFTVLYKGVDADVEAVALNVDPSTGEGTRGFRVNNVPIDRQLSVSLRLREPCHNTTCTFCPNETGNPDAEYRIRFSGIRTYLDVEDVSVQPLTFSPNREVCDCEQ